jgi:2-C-methyl-D-erythritol 2,4-cyclodiphosphate synthase
MFRIGNGYDVHRLVKGRKLILGGVEIPHTLGLDGHSDADALLHAISDALLGAIGKGDIGKYFPDTDPKWKGVSSLILLREVGAMCEERGFAISNIDSIIAAEKPKIAPHIKAMKKNIADALGIDQDQVNVKATTTETLGYVGREEGMAAYAVALLQKRDETK